MASSEVESAKPSESSAQGKAIKVDTGEGWRRLSPIAIAYFTLRSIKSMAQGAIYAVPAIAVTANITDNIQSPNTLLGIAAIFIIFFSNHSSSISNISIFFTLFLFKNLVKYSI